MRRTVRHRNRVNRKTLKNNKSLRKHNKRVYRKSSRKYARHDSRKMRGGVGDEPQAVVVDDEDAEIKDIALESKSLGIPLGDFSKRDGFRGNKTKTIPFYLVIKNKVKLSFGVQYSFILKWESNDDKVKKIEGLYNILNKDHETKMTDGFSKDFLQKIKQKNIDESILENILTELYQYIND